MGINLQETARPVKPLKLNCEKQLNYLHLQKEIESGGHSRTGVFIPSLEATCIVKQTDH